MSRESLQEIVCCVGQPVAGNPTQYMMEKALAAADLDWRYLTLEVSPEDLGDAVRGMKVLGFRGGNFAIPHKVAAIEYLDELSESAQLIGAVNCFNRLGDRLIGENTDGKGFIQSLREVTDPSGKRVVILGAGGAARAIAVEMALASAGHVTIVNRTESRGAELAGLLGDRLDTSAEFVVWDGNYEVPAGTQLLINATSIGLNDAAARVPIAAGSLAGSMVVADVIAGAVDTWLVREAADRGCTTLNGLGMLINQAVIGFTIWTGAKPDVEVMREAVEEFFGL